MSLEDWKEKQKDYLIGIAYIISISVLFILAAAFNSHLLASAALFISSTLFCFSYFKPENSFLFGAILYITQNLAWVKRPEWYALIYAGLFFLMAFIALLVGAK